MKNLVIVSFPAKEEKFDILKNAMKDALPSTSSAASVGRAVIPTAIL